LLADTQFNLNKSLAIKNFVLAAKNGWCDYMKITAKFLFAFCFLILHQHKAYCQVHDTVAVRANVFDTLRQVPQNNRVAAANTIYKFNFRHEPVGTAMFALDKLNALAKSLNDESLQCAVFEMRADYYSVNRGFNATSTAYYKQAVNFAAANDMLFEKGFYLHQLGLYYFNFKRNVLACGYFLQSQEIFNQVGYTNIPDISIYLSHVADFYYSVGDYDNARQNLETALKYIPQNKRDKINIINTIGLIYRNYSQFTQALNYFNTALNMSIAIKDTIWVAISRGNIGSVYFLKGDYKKALPYIQTDYYTSIRYGETLNGAIALLRLIKINIDNKAFAAANKQLDTADYLLRASKYDVLPYRANYYDLKSDLCEQLGRVKEAIGYRKLFEQDKDSMAKRDNVTAVERVKLSWEADKHTTQLNKIQAQEKIHTIETDAAIAVCGLLVIISVLVYNRQRLKSEKDKEILIAEKRVVDEELKSAEASLKLFTENLRQKNYLIEDFKGEVDKLSKQTLDKSDANHLEKLLQAHIMTDDNWHDFKKLFSTVYPGFFVKLNKNYQHLSSTDTRILTLVKLGLNNSEMANMLGITVEGIKKAKQRLRKKIGIENLGDV